MKRYGDQAGVFCLNRGWKFIEQDISTLPATKHHDDVYGYAKGGASRGPADSGFDDRDWQSVELPHDWVTSKDFTSKGSPNQGYKERGVGWYRLRFSLPEEDVSKQLLLEFEGLSANAEIYVNGTILKRSYSGYHGFCVDITDMANFGIVPNTLAVRIDASSWEGWWYEGAGIYRNVWLVKKSEAHIAYQGVYLKTEQYDETHWGVPVCIDLENSFEYPKDIDVNIILSASDGYTVCSSIQSLHLAGFEKKTIEDILFISNPFLWNIDHPYLYSVKTVVSYDGIDQDYQVHTTGFRTIKLLPDKGFFINEKPLKLKGFCNHQDHAGIGVAVPYSVREFRLRKLKELGANAFRSAHNPCPDVLDICDRIGLMVMEENRTFSTASDVLNDVCHMVKNARNHPSVILYSIFNEEPLQGTRKGRRMAGKLQSTIKGLDTSRPVLGAFNGGYLENVGAATILDAVGINYNPQRYDDFHEKYPETPLIGSETASAFMVRGEYETSFDHHRIANYDDNCALWGTSIADAWTYVKERPFVAGSFVWTGFDYRGEPTPFEWPSVSTFFGTYDSCGFEKDACYLYKAYWKNDPLVHIISPWKEGRIGESLRVLVVSNCQEVEILINGELLERQVVSVQGKVECQIMCQTGILEVVGYKDGVVVARDSQHTSTGAKQLVLDHVSGVVTNNGLDVAVINVSLMDNFGQIVPTAEDLVCFSVSHGKIMGVGNGNPNSHEPDVASVRKLFHGLAQLIIKPLGEHPMRVEAKIGDDLECSLVIPVNVKEHYPYIEAAQEKIIDNWRMYYQLYSGKPDPVLGLSKNDMNSFEPVSFSGSPQTEFSGKHRTYGVYYTSYLFPENPENYNLYCSNMLGHVWVYIDNYEVYSRTDSYGGDIVIPLEKKFSGVHNITVVIYNGNPEYLEAGICSPILLQKR